MAQLDDKRPLAEILSSMDNEQLLKAAEERAKAIEEAKRKAAEAAARDKDLPEFLQGVQIAPTIVKDLDASARHPLEGNFVKSIARGESDTIAIVISSSGCGLCPGYVQGIGNPGGNVYEIKDDIPQVRQTLASKGVKIDRDTRLSYPSTVFIDTNTGAIKGFEVGAIGNSKFNSYFR